MIFQEYIVHKNNLIFGCFVLILLGHLYKDFLAKPTFKWNDASELVGLIIGIILLFKAQIKIVKIVGIMKIAAHTRQFILHDDVYYPLVT